MSRLQRLHGGALLAFAAFIPVGEGLAYAALAVCGVCCLAGDRRAAARALAAGPSRHVLIGLAVWLLAGLFAVVVAGHGWHKPGELGRWLPLLAMPVVVASAAQLGATWTQRAAQVFVGSLAVASLFALAQYGLNVRPGEWLTRVDTSGSGQGRVPGQYDRTVAGGFYFHRLKMGHVLLTGLAVVTARLAFTRLTLRRWLYEALLFVLFGVTLALTYTRGAMLAAGAGAFACWPFLRGRWRWGSALALVVVVVGALSVASVRERLQSIGSDEASSVRALVWSQGVRILHDHPLGVGLGNYSAIVGDYYDMVEPEFTVRTYPHSLVLAAWVETGPVGLFGYVGAWVALAMACVAALRRGGQGRAPAACGLFALAALWVVGLTHDVLYHNAVAMAFCGLLGWVMAQLPSDRGSAEGAAPAAAP